MMPMTHALSLCGILLFGIGGFMLIRAAQDIGKPSLITLTGASALLVIGLGLFVAAMF
jgi:hypothetical protein